MQGDVTLGRLSILVQLDARFMQCPSELSNLITAEHHGGCLIIGGDWLLPHLLVDLKVQQVLLTALVEEPHLWLRSQRKTHNKQGLRYGGVGWVKMPPWPL
jgi:hypothetical protein